MARCSILDVLVVLLWGVIALGGAVLPVRGETGAPDRFTVAALRDRCVTIAAPDLADTSCRIAKAGFVAGAENKLFYQLQQYLDGGVAMVGGVVILAPAPGVPGGWHRVIDEAVEDAAFDAPTQFSNRFGIFLDLGAHTLGTGQFPLGTLMKKQGDGWIEIDAQRWQGELAKRLPKGIRVWRGPYPDYPHLAATAVVRQEPPPSGTDPDADYEGYAAIRLSVSGDALTIDRAAWKLGSDGPCAVMADYPGCDGKSGGR